MSPHKVTVLPSPAALSQHSISKNGFLPEDTPLICLPHDYYKPWERIVEKLPTLIETQQIRQWVDRLPVLQTEHLANEPEWRRAHSMLAIIAQGYIWVGPEPSEVGEDIPAVL
jgi:indoleamine 2,3-dioxygenase